MITLPDLYNHQESMRDDVRTALAKHRRVILCAPPGCHAAGQGIMLHSGEIRKVEDVIVGDVLMGPNSAPRRVLAVGSGTGEMCRIIPTKGEPWIVNRDHILTLVRSADSTNKGGEIVDVSVREWMTRSTAQKHHWKLFRRPVEFTNSDTGNGSCTLDPYLLGIVLGDGSIRNGSVAVTTNDFEIVQFLESVAALHHVRLRQNPPSEKCPIYYFTQGRWSTVRTITKATRVVTGKAFGALTVLHEEDREYRGGKSFRRVLCECRCGSRLSARLSNLCSGNTLSCGCTKRNPIYSMFHQYGLHECDVATKFIPQAFKTGTRDTRLLVLAGLIDTDGSLSGSGFDFISKSEQLSNDVVFVARSLGLAAYVNECKKHDQHGTVGTYWRVGISGDCSVIPCRIARKRAPKRLQKKDVLRTGFKVEPIGAGEYFGFTLDGDGRYLLDDFTVTHNTGKTRLAKWILGSYASRERLQFESGRALFVVHRRGLVDNASGSFGESPELPHGLIMSGRETDMKHSVQVASIDTINSWYCGGGIYTGHTFDLIVWDEAHAHLSKLRSFLNPHDAKRKQDGKNTAYVLGLSATPQNKELNQVFKTIVKGPSPQWLIDNKFLSPFRYFQCTKGDLGKLIRKGDEYTEASVADAMSGLAGDLVKDWKRLAEGRATVGFFPRRVHAQEGVELLVAAGIRAVYLDGETPDEERHQMFDDLNEGRIDYIANVGVIERGTDIPRIGCVQMCTAVGSVVRWKQMIGRGSRIHPAVEDCYVLDHSTGIRDHGFFEDDTEWSLEWGERPAKTAETRATIECPSCGAVYRGGQCRQCGYMPTPKERKSQGLEFVGGELQEVKKSEAKPKASDSSEKLMVTALYIAGRRNMTFGQAWRLADSMAQKMGTDFRVPASVEIGTSRFRIIPHGHPDSKRKVRDTYGVTVGKYSVEDNPYREQN